MKPGRVGRSKAPRVDPSRTLGRDGLAALVRVRETTRAELAARCGVDEQTVDGWLEGRERPDTHARALLETHCHIAQSAWDQRSPYKAAAAGSCNNTEDNTNG
jgi:hypothetical protein